MSSTRRAERLRQAAQKRKDTPAFGSQIKFAVETVKDLVSAAKHRGNGSTDHESHTPEPAP